MSEQAGCRSISTLGKGGHCKEPVALVAPNGSGYCVQHGAAILRHFGLDHLRPITPAGDKLVESLRDDPSVYRGGAS